MKKRNLLALCTVVLFPSCLVICWTPWETTQVIKVPHVRNKPLKVITANGSIRVVRAGNGQVEISAKIRTATEERLERARAVAERKGDGTLEVKVQWPDGRRRAHEGCSFHVNIPGSSEVVLTSSNGSLVIEGLSGKARLSSSNGSVYVSEFNGDIEAETSNGSIYIKGRIGSVKAATSNGSIKIFGARGPVDAVTDNSSVKATLAETNKGPIHIRSSNGSIIIRVGKSFRGKLTLSTSNGSIGLDKALGARILTRKKWRAVILLGDSDSPSSVVTTTNGSIKVHALRQ